MFLCCGILGHLQSSVFISSFQSFAGVYLGLNAWVTESLTVLVKASDMLTESPSLQKSIVKPLIGGIWVSWWCNDEYVTDAGSPAVVTESSAAAAAHQHLLPWTSTCLSWSHSTCSWPLCQEVMVSGLCFLRWIFSFFKYAEIMHLGLTWFVYLDFVFFRLIMLFIQS